MSMPGRVGAPVRFPKAAATIIRRSDTQVASGFVTAKLIGVSRRILNRVSEIVYARMQRVIEGSETASQPALAGLF